MSMADKDGSLLQAGKLYKLDVPAEMPVKQFWALTVYDRATMSFIYSDSNRTTLSSYDLDKMKKNADGGVTIYVGPKPPQGFDANWIPTSGKRPQPCMPLLWTNGNAEQQDLQDAGFRSRRVARNNRTEHENHTQTKPARRRAVCALAFTCTTIALRRLSSARTKLGTIPEFHPELKLGALQGYLAATNLPDSLALIPPPPAPGSAAFALDVEVAQNTFALRDTPRFALAAADFELNVPHFVEVFSCALNTQITKDNAPYLYNLLSRAFTDIGLSTYAAKNYYKRDAAFSIQPRTAGRSRSPRLSGTRSFLSFRAHRSRLGVMPSS